jgi:PAS domain S-box-containing protein
VASGRVAQRRLETGKYDVALLEYELGDRTALDLLPAPSNTPVIVVTAKGVARLAVRALRRGAYDYLLKDQEGAYLKGLPSTIENVLARRRAEDALHESEARYQDLYDNAPDMYFQLKEDGTVISVNRRGAKQLGYEVEELVGQPVRKVVHPDDLNRVEREIQALIDEPERIYRIEFRKVRKDGSILHVAESLSVQEQHGRELEIRVLCRDVTAQKEAEERARQLQDRLARSERLESIGILAGGVAHDLNNILGPMVAYPDLLMDEFPVGSEKHEVLAEIKRSATRAAAVIRDLLTMARRGKYQLEPLDVNDVVEAYLKSASYREMKATHPDVTVNLRLAPDLPLINGSSVNLVKVLMNLVMNAFEAIPGEGQIWIETAGQTPKSTQMGYEPIPGGDFVVLKVADTGTGIRPEDQERIFEPFFTKKKMGRSGSGLGLSVVYGVVKDHRAYIDVQSDEGAGTAVMVYFPTTSEKKPAHAVTAPGDYRGTECILVVDDGEEQRKLAVTLLTGLGYTVETANNGREAVAHMREAAGSQSLEEAESPFDLVLLDMVMEEGFDGFDTYQEIHKLFPGQKCIIVSGFAETRRAREAQALGVGRYLAKPYTRDQLGREVRAVLDEDTPLSVLPE